MNISFQHELFARKHLTTNILVITIICLPVLDLLTAMTENWPLSIGQIIRIAVITVLYIWLTMSFYHQSRALLFCLQGILVIMGSSFLINWYLKAPFLFMEEAQFIGKTIYGILLLFAVLYLLRYKSISLGKLNRALPIAVFILFITYWTAMISQTSQLSYHYEKVGYTGWFFAANELGVILIILLGLTLAKIEQQLSIPSLLSIAMLLSMLPMLGTKTPLWGGLLLLVLYGLFSLIKIMRNRSSRKAFRKPIIIGVLLIIYIGILPFTPVYKNTTQLSQTTPEPKTINQTSDNSSILSSRDIYAQRMKMNYVQSSWVHQLFGIGYGGIYSASPKMVEMDGYDLLFSYGALGTIGYIGLLILVSKAIIRVYINIGYFLLLSCIGICAGISLLAGHVLFAPAVMSYIALLVLFTGLIVKGGQQDAHAS